MKTYLLSVFFLIFLNNKQLHCMDQENLNLNLFSRVAEDNVKQIISYLIGIGLVEVPKDLEPYIAYLNNDFRSFLCVDMYLNEKLKSCYGEKNAIDLFQFSKFKYKETFNNSMEWYITVKRDKQSIHLFVLSASYTSENGGNDFFNFNYNSDRYTVISPEGSFVHSESLAQRRAKLKKGIVKLKECIPKFCTIAYLLPLFVQYCEDRNDEKLDVKISTLKQRMGRSYSNTLFVTIPFVVNPWVVEHMLKKIYEDYVRHISKNI